VIEADGAGQELTEKTNGVAVTFRCGMKSRAWFPRRPADWHPRGSPPGRTRHV